MKFIHNDYLDECIRIGSKITWHFVCKMSNLYGTFTDRLCQVIFVRSISTFFQTKPGQMLSSCIHEIQVFVST